MAESEGPIWPGLSSALREAAYGGDATGSLGDDPADGGAPIEPPKPRGGHHGPTGGAPPLGPTDPGEAANAALREAARRVKMRGVI